MESLSRLVWTILFTAFLMGAAVVWAPGFFIRWGESNSSEEIAVLKRQIFSLQSELADYQEVLDANQALVEANSLLQQETEAQERRIDQLEGKIELVDAQLADSIQELADVRMMMAEVEEDLVLVENDLEAEKEKSQTFKDSLLLAGMAIYRLEQQVGVLMPLAQVTRSARREVQTYRLSLSILLVTVILVMTLRHWFRHRLVSRSALRKPLHILFSRAHRTAS